MTSVRFFVCLGFTSRTQAIVNNALSNNDIETKIQNVCQFENNPTLKTT